MRSRYGTALLGAVISIALSIVLWQVFGTALFFLFVPFVPFVLGQRRSAERTTRTCPNCGFRTEDPDGQYCPYDGARLSERE